MEIDAVHAGGNFLRRHDAKEIVFRIVRDLAEERACIIASANGTFVDLAERDAIEKVLPQATTYAPKPALGESVGASAMWQIIVAAEALRTKRLPPMLHAGSQSGIHFSTTDKISSSTAIISSCGLNQQAAGLRLSI
jgi:3-oxoacyl-(acyl-carrier-protein) synthase